MIWTASVPTNLVFIPHDGMAKAKRILVVDIQNEVARYYKLHPGHMTSRVRDRHISHPRMIAMYLARQLTPMSLPELGRRFGNRDHTTVLHAVREVEKWICASNDVAEDVHALRGRLIV